ncbi:hypothetical protein M885DRAFT_524343 [Pelagophyceae sp. CCMP2097]|nr:hypothetical protein M885DRAFT_524343 [Pelagophyceae sp. CCMP2097]
MAHCRTSEEASAASAASAAGRSATSSTFSEYETPPSDGSAPSGTRSVSVTQRQRTVETTAESRIVDRGAAASGCSSVHSRSTATWAQPASGNSKSQVSASPAPAIRRWSAHVARGSAPSAPKRIANRCGPADPSSKSGRPSPRA